jgi:carbonic anhydrase
LGFVTASRNADAISRWDHRGVDDRPGTPAAAWAALAEGNRRFVEGRREHPHSDADRRTRLAAAGQTPFALVFGCSDSRVAAELVFDRGFGDLFVVRTAGHVVDTGVLGSIEFGVTVLEVPLVVVLGHDACGAVKATLDAHSSGTIPGGYVRDVVELVTPSVLSARRRGIDDVDGVVHEHARVTAALLVERSTAVAERVAAGRCAVVAAEYKLADGDVHLLAAPGGLATAV